MANPPRAGMFPAGTVVSFRSRDFDEVASLPPLWEQRYVQIGRGRYEGGLFMAMTGKVAFALESSSVGLMIRGSIPPGSAIIAIPFGCAGAGAYRGERLSRGSAIIVFAGEELDFRSAVPFDVFTFVVERELLERHAERVLGRPVESLQGNSQGVVQLPDQMERGIRTTIGALAARKERFERELLDPATAAAFERDLCEQILGGLAPRQPRRRNVERAELAWTVEAYLREHLGQEVSISDLCRVTGAPQRTLHAAFREQIGSTPKAYLKMLLLNAVRRDLRSAPPETTVTDIAIRWGLLHLGWFAHDYKAMFGESPHATLHHRPARRRGCGRDFRAVFG